MWRSSVNRWLQYSLHLDIQLTIHLRK